MAEHVYAPRWLYGPPDGMQSVLVESQGHEDQLRLAGWMDTPAAFGTETHPAKPAQAVQRPDGASSAAPLSDEMSTALANLQGQLTTMGALLQRQDGEMSALHSALDALSGRVAALEDMLTDAQGDEPTPTTTPPADSQGRGGRK